MKTTLTLITLMLLLSCKKYSKRWTEVTIRVNNYLTGEPIDDVTCGIVYYKSHLLKPDENVVLDSGSPVNGVYHYAFKAPKAIQQAEFAYDFIKYYPVDVKQTMYYDEGKKNEFQQYLVPMGYLRTIYKNNNCFNDSDEVLFHYIKSLDLPDYKHLGTSNPIKGCNIDIVNPYVSFPIGNYEYKWSFKKNNINTVIIDTFVIEKDDYFDLIFEY